MYRIREIFRLSAVALTVILLCISSDTYAAPTLEQLKEGIQTALETSAGEALPPGVGDLVNGLKAAQRS